ncbi:MAG: hypothetical protein U9N04_00685 [Patescibacteria group bacterium]|nr:hypothetical protein [Patescibacteria group bacterium]
MDTIFHGFLTYLVFRKKKYKYKAAFWGMAPDFFPVFALIYFIYLGRLNNLELFNDFLYSDGVSVYLFSHSLTPYLLISLILFALKKKQFWLPLVGGGLHILIDILTHSEGAVKIFYPFYPCEKLSFTAQYFSDENLAFVGICWMVILLIFLWTKQTKFKTR